MTAATSGPARPGKGLNHIDRGTGRITRRRARPPGSLHGAGKGGGGGGHRVPDEHMKGAGIGEGVPGGGTVFLVDDDPSVRRALTRLLRAAGLEVASFPSAEALLAGIAV